MTELARYEEPDRAPVSPAGQGVGELVEWAQAARAAYEVAQQLVRTSFVPQAFRDRPEEATAAILAGQEVGLSPMASLRSFDIINGTAAPRAMTLRAILQAAGHEIWVEESTATRAIVKGRRRGSSTVQQSVWTMDRARQLGLAGKDNWRKQPQAMLVARATAECARLVASDAILGIGYTVEELDDEGTVQPDDTARTTARTTRRRTARRAPLEPPEPPAADEPEIDDTAAEPALEPAVEEPAEHVAEPAAEPAVEEPTADEQPEPITPAQLKKLHVLLKEYGIVDRDAGLAYYADTIGREVESSKAMTKAEASKVIDRLERELHGGLTEPAIEWAGGE